MDNTSAKEFQDTHIAVWMEKDKARRDILMDTIYSPGITMYDNDFVLHGTAEVSGFIDKVQADPAFHFAATQPLQFTQNSARLFWSIATTQGTLTGMDFFIFDQEKVTALYVFIDGK